MVWTAESENVTTNKNPAMVFNTILLFAGILWELMRSNFKDVNTD